MIKQISLFKIILQIVIFVLTVVSIAFSQPLKQNPTPIKSSSRPRIGLVLSGGGARGAAHVGVLKVLEENRIPVDLIVGTSMGSIVGGLYASGLSPEIMEAKLNEIDWEDLFSDRPPRENISFRRKEDDRLNLFPLEIGVKTKGFVFPSGFIAGQKLGFVLRSMLLHTTGIERFDDLPIPYRAVAADIATGETVVLDHGDLARAIRASMSVPGVFATVRIDGKTLVDGGIARNLPVDVAKALGVDRIIAVDISTPLEKLEGKEVSVFGVLGQTLSLLTAANVQEQIKLLGKQDLLITPDLKDIQTSDFAKVDQAIKQGEVVARKSVAALKAFSVSEEAFKKYLQKQRIEKDRLLKPVQIDSVKVTGLSRVNPKQVTRRIKTQAGKPLNLEGLSDDLERISELGEFEQIDFVLVPDREKTHLVIDAHEKPWGPTILRFGLTLQADLEGNGSFNFLADLTRTQINRLGAELKIQASVGDNNLIFTEFYQPLDYGGFLFMAPRVEYEQNNQGATLDDDSRVEFKGRRFDSAFDLGLQLKNYAELRFGIRQGTLNADIVFGSEVPESSLDVTVGGLEVRLTYDRLNNANFPRSGSFIRGDLFLSRADLNADDTYDRLDVHANKALSFGRHTLIGSARYSTSLGSDIPFYDEFKLGGFLNLSGLELDQLQGDTLGFLRLIYFAKIGKPGTFAKGIYLGGSLEAGNVWEDSNDFDLEDLRAAGSVFVGVDSILGPFYLGYGRADQGDKSFYLFLGRPL
jgi:NTE family protein